jgi:DNA-binding transcriptional regulator GbsR (MarR family)
MEQETLFTSAKWSILKALALEKKSPLELAELANTSMSNISQSLRFLELANIVKSERISNRDKGQPRIIYSLAKDNAYLIVTSEGFVEKRMIEIDNHKKIMIRIWLYPDEKKHEKIEQAYRSINIEDVDAIFIEENTDLVLRVIYKDNEEKNQSTESRVSIKKITADEVKKSPEKYYPIHDPQKINKRMIT